MKETKEKSMNMRIQGIRWTDVGLCILAFICARVGISGTFYIIGIGFLGSLLYFKELKVPATVFSILGIISLGQFNIGILKYLLMIGVLAVIRGYFTLKKKQPRLINQVICTGIVVAIINLAASWIVGISVYGIVASILEAIVGGGFVLLFGESIKILRDNRKTPLTTKESIAMMILIGAVLAGMVDLYIQLPYFKEIYLRDILTFIMIIGITYLGGVNIGTTTTIVMSTILVLIRYMPTQFVAIYGIAAIIGGVFLPIGRIGVISGVGIGLLLGSSIFNEGNFDLTIIGAYCIAALVSLILPKNYFGFSKWFVQKSIEENEKTHLVRVQKVITDRMKHIITAFDSLSKTLEEMERPQLQISDKDMETMIRDSAEKICLGCSMKQFCWQQDLDNTYAISKNLVDKVLDKGYITKGDIPPKFRQNCLSAENYAAILTSKLDMKKMEIYWHNKMIESKYLAAQQLSAIATTLDSLVVEVEEEMEFNKGAEKDLEEKLRAEGLRITEVMVLENQGKKREVNIYTPYCHKMLDISQKMIDAIEECLGIRVELEKHICHEKGCEYKFAIANKYFVTAGSAVWAKQQVCGDVHSFMELEDGQYMLALADGMGSGYAAQEESTATIEMLENFMSSGLKKDTVIKLINSTLLLKSEAETFSTMDVTLIDSQTGIAEFLKAGAATSFILRKGKVLTVTGESLPVGIVKDVEVETQKMQLQDGDMLVMVTDGILATKDDVFGKEGTFKHFILEVGNGNPQYVAEYLMKKSKDLLGIDDEDDMTIIVARIWKNNKK